MYKGICKTTFKKPYTNHKKYFDVEKNNNTKLSAEYWKLANKKFLPQVVWSIKGNYKKHFMAPFYGLSSTASRLELLRGGSLLFIATYNPDLRRCNLCLHEKLAIADDAG